MTIIIVPDEELITRNKIYKKEADQLQPLLHLYEC